MLSRGQMVEIGDGFRVAEMAGAGGVPVVAVGSTNRTHVGDYAAALDAGAAAILWVHLSNFSQAGFVAQPELATLAGLARERGVPLLADLGSGSLGGLPGDEPTVQAYLAAGADLVCFSGDKLLGGPQAGLVAGRGELVARCRRHPLARALRPDKTTIAALHATAADDAQAWPATVSNCSFLGEKIELHLDCAGQRLLLVRPGGAGAALPEGQALGVTADPASMLLLPAQDKPS